MTVVFSPDEVVLRSHLQNARFRLGEIEGRWRIEELAWPSAIAVVTAAPRENSPLEFAFKLDLSGYPEIAPTACIWDRENDRQLPGSARPKGADGEILQLFRDNWLEGKALYAPFDRLALADHGPTWADQWPMSKWTPARDLAFFLGRIYDELNSADYAHI
jgi:hypothetical protein